MRTSRDVSAPEIPFEYWMEYVTFGLLFAMLKFFTRILYMDVSGFATVCP